MGIANKGGRPLKFKSPEELKQKIEAYYKWAETNKKHITITGLAWFIGTNRTTLLKYEDADCDLFKSITDEAVKVAFSNTIIEAKDSIEMESEERLYYKNSVVGSILL